MKRLSDISTYLLVVEFCENGNAGLISENEPIEVSKVADELGRRSGRSFTNCSDWINWFVQSSDFGTDVEKMNLKKYKNTKDEFARIYNKGSKPSSV